MEVDYDNKTPSFHDYLRTLFGELDESQSKAILKQQEKNQKKSLDDPYLQFSSFCDSLTPSPMTQLSIADDSSTTTKATNTSSSADNLLKDLKLASSWFEIEDGMVMNEKLKNEFQKFNQFKEILDLFVQYFHASKFWVVLRVVVTAD